MNNSLPFRQVAAQWKESKRQLVKPSTLCAYSLILQTHLLHSFGDCKQIAEAGVQQFVFDKLAAGLGKKTVHDIVAVLKAIVKYGAKHGIFKLEQWEISFPTDTEKRKLPVLSLAHQRKLTKSLTEKPSAQNIGILLSIFTGMRIGEVCGLRWQDIDLTRQVITAPKPSNAFMTPTKRKPLNAHHRPRQRTPAVKFP